MEGALQAKAENSRGGKDKKNNNKKKNNKTDNNNKNKDGTYPPCPHYKRQITHKESDGGGLMSSAGNVVRLDTWSGFASHNNMKRQKLLLSNIKKSNFLLQHASQQVTALAIPG